MSVVSIREASSPRQLPDFISAFLKYGETFNTTPLYLEAAAHWMIGTAVGRGIAMQARGNALSPNTFQLLIGGPGTGKSQAVNATRSIYIPATSHSLIPASVTRAGMEDYMTQNLQQRKAPGGELLMSHECLGLSEELQGILPEHDISHLTLYNILYDLPDLHIAQTRSMGQIRLESPYCSILSGAQPAFLALQLPEHAWGMGFMSRSLMVFDTKPERKSVFDLQSLDRPMQARLIADLKHISSLYGWMQWSEEAREIYRVWWVEHGGPPVPNAKRLAMGYNSRREIHFLKYSMTASLSRGSDLIVSGEDARRALEFLLKLENRMVHVFQEMTNTGAMVALQDVLDMVRNRSAGGGSVSEAEIINFLMERFPATQVHALIDNLMNAGLIALADIKMGARGFRKFKAGPRLSAT